MVEARGQWPDDVDGDVLRQMEEGGFDFSVATDIDFNIDFETWPPSVQFMTELAAHYPDAEVVDPDGDDDDDGDGYVRVVVRDFLTYELVMRVQEQLSALAAPYGGVCESWGAFG